MTNGNVTTGREDVRERMRAVLRSDPAPRDRSGTEMLEIAFDHLEMIERLVLGGEPLSEDEAESVARFAEGEGLPTDPMPEAAVGLWIKLTKYWIAATASTLAGDGGEDGAA